MCGELEIASVNNLPTGRQQIFVRIFKNVSLVDIPPSTFSAVMGWPVSDCIDCITSFVWKQIPSRVARIKCASVVSIVNPVIVLLNKED